ncbi:MAG: histidine kinase [Arcicella sp.]|nr:histidine kinase [Arcicella sp.]
MYCFIDSSQNKTAFRKYIPFEQVQFPSFLWHEYQYDFWFKCCLKNPTKDSLTYLISMGDVYKQAFYLSSSSSPLRKIIISQDSRFNEGDYPFDHKYLNFRILPYETITIEVKMNDLIGQKFKLSPSLITPAYAAKEKLKLIYQERPAVAFNIILNAILFFVFLFVLVQYYFVRERYLFLYAFYVFFMMCFHLYGFSYSPFVKTPLSVFPFLQFTLRQNFYIIVTQLFYMSFLADFFKVQQLGSYSEKRFFNIINRIFLLLLGFELFFSITKQLEFELMLSLFTQFMIIIVSLGLLKIIFTSITIQTPLLVKLANTTLFIGVIFGFVSATLEWVPTTSDILYYYPNFFFNACVLAEIFLYSLAIGQQYFKNIAEKSLLNQKIALAELNTLRSQINPHFLFNSLNSIKSMIIQNKTDDAAAFLTDFSSLIRNILQQSREQFWTLNQELQLTEDYLKIEKKRFKDGFDYQIIVDENAQVGDWLVPSLILQPFVENAIKHGFKNGLQLGTVQLNISQENNFVVIKIEDDGIGRERASKLNLQKEQHTSIGTTLFEDRLKILYEVYQLKIEFEILDLQNPSGTVVIIKIPYFD